MTRGRKPNLFKVSSPKSHRTTLTTKKNKRSRSEPFQATLDHLKKFPSNWLSKNLSNMTTDDENGTYIGERSDTLHRVKLTWSWRLTCLHGVKRGSKSLFSP